MNFKYNINTICVGGFVETCSKCNFNLWQFVIVLLDQLKIQSAEWKMDKLISIFVSIESYVNNFSMMLKFPKLTVQPMVW